MLGNFNTFIIQIVRDVFMVYKDLKAQLISTVQLGTAKEQRHALKRPLHICSF